MARYLSAHLKRMHMVGDMLFQFTEGMLELDDPEMIKVLDSEIKLAKARGVAFGIEKVQEVPKVLEVVEDKAEDEVEPVRQAPPISHDPDQEIKKLAEKVKKGK